MDKLRYQEVNPINFESLADYVPKRKAKLGKLNRGIFGPA